MRLVPLLMLMVLWSGCASAQSPATSSAPTWIPVEGDYVGGALITASGAVLPELKIHYRTLGAPTRGPDGQVTNAILLLHGTGGAGSQFLSPQFATELFGAGQPLDVARFYIIVPDNLGHGLSSKPSDGLRAGFPEYGYADMVEPEADPRDLDGLYARLRLG